MIKVLYVASEAVPFVKTGGLADVAFSLPKELRKLGIDIRIVIPKYNSISDDFRKNMRFLKSINVEVGWRRQYCGIEYIEYENVPYYFIDNEYYFKRDSGYGIYGYYDEAERFSFFNRAVLEMIDSIEFKPDIIHCNDWHTGMISTFLKVHYKDKPNYKDIKTIFTIHNLKYQGIFSPEILGELLNLGTEYLNLDSLEFYGGVSFMKGGINYSDVITTVSNSYSKEIQTPYYGEQLDGLLRSRNKNLYGIVNGIDYKIYNPEDDKHIFKNYNINTIDKKLENKLKLQEYLNIPQKKDVPLIGMVTRLEDMKGLDLVIHILDELLSIDVQMVILGTGSSYYESILKDFENKCPNKLSVNILFDNSFAHKIYAGCDMFLMPSLFEPCGLSQLIALRYGTLPIVRETGGLRDTVNSYNEFTKQGNGFSFTNYNAHDMLYTIKRALRYYGDKKIWHKIIKNAMDGNYSWKNSACTYEELYKALKYDS
ncbi:glycogen synthase GlgA [Tepidibacter formicigenes]|jgi:starch synthase|uniref:Glycogen synthase n=1 Tax=Tepidibacter formicigenes DSM 15518 TaxID=1123349 RepID=A0A1M6SJH5_9FIRM|nr:glycogen synthase GlgA [Tepidibacter formicigenes]SHK44843.1 starch synthase [Tepidibacter formicigenes DSM 15518]